MIGDGNLRYELAIFYIPCKHYFLSKVFLHIGAVAPFGCGPLATWSG